MHPLDRIAAEIEVAVERSAPGAVIVGIGGPVAVGKTTITRALSARLQSSGTDVRVISTDSFLLPNDVLAGRDLLMRKGFPETYDLEGLAVALDALKERREVTVAVYSHAVYDIVEGEAETVEPADVVIVEGVVALQPPVVSRVDPAIYVDAQGSDVKAWYVERFSALVDAARDDPGSFYTRFCELSAEQIGELAEATWDGINAVNLREHIEPSRANATVVIEKASDHRIIGCHAG